MADLKTQGETVSESLKAITETLKGLNSWMPKVDGTMSSLQKAVDDVGGRVAFLEAGRNSIDAETPQAGLMDPEQRVASLNATLGRAHIEAQRQRRSFPSTPCVKMIWMVAPF